MEYRLFAPELEVRSAARRLLCGIVVPYGVEQRIDDSLTERFEQGAFTHLLRSAHRVALLHLHSNVAGHTPLGRAVELREDAAGLYGELRVTESVLGDHFLSLAKEGSLRQWSIGFRPERDRREGAVTVRTKATVKEVALVPEGAYGELAAVAAVRSVPLRRDILLAKLPKPILPA